MKNNEMEKETNNEVDDKSYDTNIDSVTNGILNIIYYIVTIISMPIMFYCENIHIYALIIFFVLMTAVIFTNGLVKKFSNASQRQKCADFFNRFEKDFYIYGYLITAMGYILVFIDSFSFWYVYIALIGSAIIIFIGNIRSPTKNNKINSISSDISSNEKYKGKNANKRFFYKIKLKEMLHRKKYIKKVKIEYSYEKELQKHSSHDKDTET